MGTSTDAKLAFGFDLGEELPESLTKMDPESEEEYFDFDEWVWRRMGVADAEYEVRSEAVKAFPFDLITHCSYDYPMYFLAARGSEQTARRGYPETIKLPTASPEQIQAMRDFCTEFEIEWREPSWQIFSLWG